MKWNNIPRQIWSYQLTNTAHIWRIFFPVYYQPSKTTQEMLFHFHKKLTFYGHILTLYKSYCLFIDYTLLPFVNRCVLFRIGKFHLSVCYNFCAFFCDSCAISLFSLLFQVHCPWIALKFPIRSHLGPYLYCYWVW